MNALRRPNARHLPKPGVTFTGNGCDTAATDLTLHIAPINGKNVKIVINERESKGTPMDLRGIREKLGMTQRGLAAALGITAAYMNDLEHNRREITDARIMGVADPKLRRLLANARAQEYRAKIDMLLCPVRSDPRKRFTVPTEEIVFGKPKSITSSQT